MSQHLIDAALVGWSEHSTDLLDGAPNTLRAELTGGENFPSKQLNNFTSPDGSAPERRTITEENTSGLNWGYVLHPHGIEVISFYDEEHGPLVDWNTNPRARFSDHPTLWSPARPVPVTSPPRITPPGPPATPSKAAPASARPVTHR